MPVADSPYLSALADRVLVFDGALGTNLQVQNLTAEDFGGPELEGCNEYLVISKPEAVEKVHADFFEVGCDVTETDTFGSFSLVLAEYGLADRAYEITKAAAELARRVADRYSTPEQPRFVAGSMGPGTKFPTLGQIPYQELRDSYTEQAGALIDGGADFILIETMFDLLGAKAAINGARAAMVQRGVQLPIQVQVTIELTGRMLPGTEIQAALTSLAAMQVDVVGLNCATGPVEMGEAVRHLSEHAPMFISVLPNAGLPSVVDGAMHYDLTPEQLADHLARFVGEQGVSAVGGCCGTTPAHLAAVVERVRKLDRPVRQPVLEPSAASIYSEVTFSQENSFLIVGERTNANGSKKFREAMLAGDVDTCVAMAREQVREGAQVLDLCVDYTGADGVADMEAIASQFATQSSVPLMVDTTEAEVAETALRWLGGRALLNSVNLEEGAAEGTRLDKFLKLAREFGAAVVVTCIDEDGQARTADWKLKAAKAVADLATQRYGLRLEDLMVDPLVLPLSTGMEESRRDGIETLEGIKAIKAALPGVSTVVGLSNVSFGLNPAARQALNSVFLHEAMEAGLDAAIVHASKIVPLAKVEESVREACLDLIYDRRREGYDPLARLIELTADAKVSGGAEREDRSGWPVTDRLRQRIIDGDRNGLEAELDEAMGEGLAPLVIVNDHLLEGMKVVGELFGAGEMQLPFVLQSAETMKAAVAHLEPHMEKSDQGGKGKVVLATVKGDVHDIGKNLVDIILTNNGYEVVNLGIKISIAEMIEKATEVSADAIGMSGLLVKSTLIMRENLEELNARGLANIPVLLGGAALTRSYVERDLREVYEGRLFYGKDAFEGLNVMDRLGEIKRGATPDDPDWGRVPSESRVPARSGSTPSTAVVVDLPARSPGVVTDNEIFEPPFLGTKVVKGIPIDDIAAYINETALFRNQWQFRPETVDGVTETDEEFKDRIRAVLRAQLSAAKADDMLVPQVVYGYFAVNADGDDLVVWTDASRTAELARFSYPRQTSDPYLCIADFFRSFDDGVDYAAFHIVTMGHRVSEVAADLFAQNRYQEYLLVHGLGVEMAEALAEYWHHRIRTEWGFVADDGPSLAGLFRQQYRGGRYSWGYPACPDLADNETVARILDAGRLGIEVNEDTGFQYQPEQTTSALICHHPQAKYFVAR